MKFTCYHTTRHSSTELFAWLRHFVDWLHLIDPRRFLVTGLIHLIPSRKSVTQDVSPLVMLMRSSHRMCRCSQLVPDERAKSKNSTSVQAVNRRTCARPRSSNYWRTFQIPSPASVQQLKGIFHSMHSCSTHDTGVTLQRPRSITWDQADKQTSPLHVVSFSYRSFQSDNPVANDEECKL